MKYKITREEWVFDFKSIDPLTRKQQIALFELLAKAPKKEVGIEKPEIYLKTIFTEDGKVTGFQSAKDAIKLVDTVYELTEALNALSKITNQN